MVEKSISVYLEHVRSFADAQTVPIRPLTLLVGENSSGKTTFLAVAHASGLSPAGVDCPAEGTVIRGDDRRYRISTIALRPRVTVSDEALREKTLRLMAKAESACLIWASMSATVTMEPEVVVSAQIAPGKPMV